MASLDHLILNVNDVAATVAFYTSILGFQEDGKAGPFTVLRVNATTTLQLAQRKTDGGEHLAFALSKSEFDQVFARIRERGLDYGPSFLAVGTQTGPGDEIGAEGMGKAIYFFDPSKHLLEIRHYDR